MATKKAAAKRSGATGAQKKAGAKASKKSAAKKSAAKSPVKRFRALVERGEGSAVCAIHFPFDVEQTFGARGHVPVRGTLNGAPFRASIFKMGGRHFMVVNRRLREASGVSGGETVPVRLERDTEPRTIDPPADFARALKGDEEARATWDVLSYTHRREHVEHIEDAKRPETRQRRIEKSVALLAAGAKGPRG
ncbi:MAG: YdeI/OmpD-associated family protein [Acidobacteria bacterium]|nr:YdeI/OmpD-associated family protein [Acidobacteriota bacterium]